MKITQSQILMKKKPLIKDPIPVTTEKLENAEPFRINILESCLVFTHLNFYFKQKWDYTVHVLCILPF